MSNLQRRDWLIVVEGLLFACSEGTIIRPKDGSAFDVIIETETSTRKANRSFAHVSNSCPHQ